MCTIAFLQGPNGHFILAGNRDEARTRKRALPPIRHQWAEGVQTYPIDADAGGTWIGANTWGMAATLLNGYQADAANAPKTPTRSRGDLIPRLLTSKTQEDALGVLLGLEHELPFIRPFVLACGQANKEGALEGWTAQWDGQTLTTNRFNQRLVLVSSGVELEQTTRARTHALSTLSWSPNTQTVLDAFAQDHNGEPSFDSVCMARVDARSVSHTCIEVSPRGVTLTYLDGPPSSNPARHIVRLECLAR